MPALCFAMLPLRLPPHAPAVVLARALIAMIVLAPVLAPAQTGVLPGSATSPPPASCPAPSDWLNGGGNPCNSRAGPATQGSAGEGGVPIGAGNPVNLLSGNKYQLETDLPALPGVLGIEIVRHYNSAHSRTDDRPGIMGRGWKLSYETSLRLGRKHIEVEQADGSRLVFRPDPRQPDRFRHHHPARGVIERIIATPAAAQGTLRWQWRWVDGRRLEFNARGQLLAITAPGGERLSLSRAPDGILLGVTDPQGRSLRLAYPPAATAARAQFTGVRHIDSPAGRFVYAHGHAAAAAAAQPGAPAAAPPQPDGLQIANLVAVRHQPRHDQADADEPAPRPRARFYHYEDARHPAFLTGISISTAPPANAGPAPARRIATYAYDEIGRATASVRDPDSARADGVWIAYTQPESGASLRQTVLTNPAGGRTVYTFAPVAGEFRLVEVSGAGCRLCGPTNQRYGYDTEGRLREISALPQTGAAAPQTHIARDALGRVVEIRRTAMALAAAGAGSDRRDHPGTLLRLDHADARWPFKPTAVAWPGASPGRLEQLRLAYDERGEAVRRTLERHPPGGGTTVSEFDGAGRLAAMTDARGNHARYAYDPHGRIVRQSVSDASSGATTTTTWEYAGKHLHALHHPSQREHYEYDASQRELVRTRIIQGEGHDPVVITRQRHDRAGRLNAATLPDGSVLHYQRDGAGNTVELTLNPVRTPWLQWLGRPRTLLTRIERDAYGIRRYRSGNGIEARHQRDRGGRLARIQYRHVAARRGLPPGAALLDSRYRWDRRGNLLSLRQRPAASAQWHQHDYAHDRSDRLIASVRREPLGTLTGTMPGTAGQAIAATRAGMNGMLETAVARFAYDPLQRRVAAQHTPHGQHDTRSGTELTHYLAATHRRAATPYTAAGQPLATPAGTLSWDAHGHLAAVTRPDGHTTRYRYDHRGLRNARLGSSGARYFVHDDQRQLLAELDQRGHIVRQYVYLAGVAVAVIDSPAGLPPATQRGALAQVLADLRTLLREWLGQRPRIVWLHPNHLGAPEAATSATGDLVWRASYDAFGAATVNSFGFQLALRLPGQYADDDTGLHYNRQRYYDPARGEYLSPDPLGTPDGPNPYAYAAFNPLRFIDPDGLILFAFDGTGNTAESLTNVYWLKQAYADNDLTRDDNGAYVFAAVGAQQPFYIEGPGTGMLLDGALAYSLDERIRTQLDRLDRYTAAKWDYHVGTGQQSFSPTNPLGLELDVIGFSRGAAAARDFANQLLERRRSGHFAELLFGPDASAAQYSCVDIRLRFLGLFDTVLSTAIGSTYQLALPDGEIGHIAHAVAVNEHRAMFPLESIELPGDDPGGDPARLEMGFIGAHSDIGGGYQPQDGGDLSDVALNWMWQQAVSAGVPMSALADEQKIVAHPLLHDESSALIWNLPGTGLFSSDREVRFADATATQKEASFALGMDWEESQRSGFIRYYDSTGGDGESGACCNNPVGSVDMTLYTAWLSEHGISVR